MASDSDLDRRVAYAKRRRELLEQHGTADPALLREKMADLWDVVAAEVLAAAEGADHD